ncbi:MAG: hypothetical protein RRA15_13665 [bacterium]|nr:hypothetical protein [bacterium]
MASPLNGLYVLAGVFLILRGQAFQPGTNRFLSTLTSRKVNLQGCHYFTSVVSKKIGLSI